MKSDQHLPFSGHHCLPPVILAWKQYYLIYNHRLLFVIGLMFSRSLTRTAIVSALAWYLTSNGDASSSVMISAIFTNIQGSLSLILELPMAHAAHSSLFGILPTLFISHISYIIALGLFWKLHPQKMNLLLVVTIVLLSLGTSGSKILQDQLVDFVHDIKDPDTSNQDMMISTDDDMIMTRSVARAKIWSGGAYLFGGLIAILLVAPDAIIVGVHSWGFSFFICLITMTLALIIFGVGQIVYHHRSVKLTLEIFMTHISRCLPGYSRQVCSMNLDIEMEENEKIAQEIPTTNFDTKGKEDGSCQKNLDIENGENDQRSIHTKGKEEESNKCSHKQDHGVMLLFIVKSLLRMFPIWGVFLMLSIISATGSAFFSLQYNNLNTNKDIAVQFYSLVQSLSQSFIPYVYSCWICSRLDEYYKVLIWMGLATLIFYSWIAKFFYKDQVLANNDENSGDNDLQELVNELTSEVLENRELVKDDQEQDNLDLANEDLQQELVNGQVKDALPNQNLSNDDQKQDRQVFADNGLQWKEQT
ncbi:hypothetical protein QVD17_02964 [Tagetes erecta]|uniref:Uncharacterized protein n=1 Tax=Tagetes erecta TaxID=13708 RepID=A0AAD8P884_TARER|nr:hypothetical protein QVD17_02964 [Tagetes erecta]